MEEQIRKILIYWGLQEKELKQICDTAWQIGDAYVLKIYYDLNMMKRNLKLLCILDSMNIPVGQIISTLDNQQYIINENINCFLSKKLMGSNIIQLGNDISIAYVMGEIIAELHIAFKKCEDISVFLNNSLLDEMKGWIKNSLEKSLWKYINKEEYEEIVSKLESVYYKLPVQLIHRDVHFGNFLFDNGKFSGYIDFDLSQRNIRIFDICYFLLSLLSEKEKLQISEECWFEFVKNTFKGYESKLELSIEEKKAVPYVMESIELLFIAWFMKQKDTCCVNNVDNIFRFIKLNEDRIWKNIFYTSL